MPSDTQTLNVQQLASTLLEAQINHPRAKFIDFPIRIQFHTGDRRSIFSSTHLDPLLNTDRENSSAIS